jgi:hypothetical protein
MPRLCECYSGIYLTTEEKAQKNLSEDKKNLSQINVAKGREKWHVAVKMVMNLGYHKMQGIC